MTKDATKRSHRKGAGKDSAMLERGVSELPQERYVLRLYVSGTTPRSANAITNIKKICEEKLKGRYDLEVIDIYQGGMDKSDDIIAIPTLIKKLPLPLRKLIGDLSEEEKVLVVLDLKKNGE